MIAPRNSQFPEALLAEAEDTEAAKANTDAVTFGTAMTSIATAKVNAETRIAEMPEDDRRKIVWKVMKHLIDLGKESIKLGKPGEGSFNTLCLLSYEDGEENGTGGMISELTDIEMCWLEGANSLSPFGDDPEMEMAALALHLELLKVAYEMNREYERYNLSGLAKIDLEKLRAYGYEIVDNGGEGIRTSIPFRMLFDLCRKISDQFGIDRDQVQKELEKHIYGGR